jgi:sugar-specific transcriptional regulator TrmB
MIDFSTFGLESRDKRVYDALLKNPEASIRKIADVTAINRGSVYVSLKSLTATGLVAHIYHGKAVRYVAENPEKLHEIIDEQRRNLLNSHSEVDNYIEELKLNKKDGSVLQFASFYDGDEGMASILRDVLSTCRVQGIKEYRVISSPRVSEFLYNNFRHYTRERIKQDLQVKVLRQNKASLHDADLSRWRILPNSPLDTGCYMIIYGTKLAIASIDTYNHTSGIIIDNSGVAKTQENLFDLLWGN